MRGPANYLLGILGKLKASFLHIPPSKTLNPSFLKRRFDAIILSDFSKTHVPSISEKMIAQQVEEGTGFLMIGGWGSFSGPFGRWKGSLIEKILPVSCLGRDDRLNFPGGALIVPKKKHRALQSISFGRPPVICGLNRIKPKRNSLTLLSARRIVTTGNAHRIALEKTEFPLLVVDRDPRKRIAALTTDLAPHWCG
ncbi:MAG: hypothetical protein HY447_05865, partial [Candidatus Omnitrophica bacterium]|nr:hypothetical protein [Candidatus Omnitrophota bacterium]